MDKMIAAYGTFVATDLQGAQWAARDNDYALVRLHIQHAQIQLQEALQVVNNAEATAKEASV